MLQVDQHEVLEVRVASILRLYPGHGRDSDQCGRDAHALLLSWTLQGFIKSWGMILLSEIGDKTFFIAAIMAMKNPRRWVRSGRQEPLTFLLSEGCMAGANLADDDCYPAGFLGSHWRAGSNDSTVGGHGMGRAKSGASTAYIPVSATHTASPTKECNC